MTKRRIRKIIVRGLVGGLCVAGCLVFYAFARTWGKTDLEFKIHINEELVMQSVYGESPTFAIWIENQKTGSVKTIFVTDRAGKDDWEGKVDVPVALPQWDEMMQKQNHKSAEADKDELDATTGATPKPGYFTSRVRVEPESQWICWIEMNLAGDYNEHYQEYDKLKNTTDEYATGQPALVYRAEIKARKGNVMKPELVGMSVYNSDGAKVLQPVQGITTAAQVFDEMSIEVVQPKPRIINKK